MEHSTSRHLHFLSSETCAKKQAMAAWRVEGFQTSDQHIIMPVQALRSRSVDIPHTSHFREDTLSCIPFFSFWRKTWSRSLDWNKFGAFLLQDLHNRFITSCSNFHFTLCQLKQRGYNTGMFFQTEPTELAGYIQLVGLEILLWKSLPFLPLHVSAPHRQSEELFLMHT